MTLSQPFQPEPLFRFPNPDDIPSAGPQGLYVPVLFQTNSVSSYGLRVNPQGLRKLLVCDGSTSKYKAIGSLTGSNLVLEKQDQGECRADPLHMRRPQRTV